MPDYHIGYGESDDRFGLSFRNRQGCALYSGYQPQCRQSADHAQGAKSHRRKIVHADFHDWPIDAPAQGEEYEKDPVSA